MGINEFSTWDEICNYEKYLENNRDMSNHIIQFSRRESNSKLFLSALLRELPKKSKILDLACSGTPWFSYLCADNGMNVYALDIQKPTQIEILSQKKIKYIIDDVNNLEKYNEQLSELDLIHCRGFSVLMKLKDWYEEKSIKLWNNMLSLLKDDGIIYWMQMTNGYGNFDGFFQNHTAKYFAEFFKKLDVEIKITKYGYMVLKISKKLKHPWNEFQLTLSDNSKIYDLYKNKEYRSLIKNYAFQLHYFYEKNEFNLDYDIEIYGNVICANIARMLLLDNFRYRNVKIVKESKKTTVRINGDAKLKEMELSNYGLLHDEYFLVDQLEDNRFSDEYLDMLRNYYLKDSNLKI